MQRVDAVLPRHVAPAAGELFRQDRATHQQHGHTCGGDAADQQPGERGEISRQLQHEDHRCEGHLHRAAHERRHPDHGPQAGIGAVQGRCPQRPHRAAHHEEWSEHAARRTRAEPDRPDQRLHDEQDEQEGPDQPTRHEIVDHVVTDAEGPRRDQPAEPHDHPRDGGPPHPMDGQASESVLDGVQQVGDERRGDARDQPDAEALGERRRGEQVVRWDGEVRPGAEQRNAQRRSHRRRAGDGDETARLPLEQEQLDGEQDGRDGRGEDRRHPGRRAGHE